MDWHLKDLFGALAWLLGIVGVVLVAMAFFDLANPDVAATPFMGVFVMGLAYAAVHAAEAYAAR